MTALAASGRRVESSLVRWLPVGVILAAVGGAILARWWATRAGLDALAVGAAFGLGLVIVWGAAARASRTAPRAGAGAPTILPAVAVLIGAMTGLGLVALTVLGGELGGSLLPPGLGRPAAPFAPWALVTLVVAIAEEGVLRGVLFDRVRDAGGLGLAVVLTSVAFALLHVPLYGWHVVPLDLAVGLLLAGLRLGTGGIAAPAAAHAVADLATWWL